MKYFKILFQASIITLLIVHSGQELLAQGKMDYDIRFLHSLVTSAID
jgi:hypothetical protein